MSIARYIREIGRGRDGARALGSADAHDLMSQVLDRRVSDLEIGAFALAMRIKGESVSELIGFLEAAEERCMPLRSDAPTIVLPAYNGSRRIANLTPLLALLLARRGARVLVHGSAPDGTRVTTVEVFRELGFAPASDAGEVEGAWRRGEPALIRIETLCPPLARLLDVRRIVGVRNSGHTIAKLLAGCRGAAVLRVVNFTHPDYATLLAEFVAETLADAILMRGTEGEPVADARRLQKLDAYVAGERRDDLSLPAQTGILTEPALLPPGNGAATTARHIASVLDGALPAPPSIEAQVDCLLGAVAAIGSMRTRDASG